MSFVKGDPKTAGETMFLLNLGETLEDYTKARSESALIDALLDVSDTAQLVEGDTETEVRVASLEPGNVIAIRTGMAVSVDGEVVGGTAMVNQASLTGEPLAVERTVGDDVFAGTSVEDGEILVRVKSGPGGDALAFHRLAREERRAVQVRAAVPPRGLSRQDRPVELRFVRRLRDRKSVV